MSLRPVALFSLLALALVGCEPVQPDLEDSWLDGLTESEVERTLEALADFDVPLDASPARMRREQRALERELVAILGVDRAADFPGFDADRREAIRSRQTSPRGLVATCEHDEVDAVHAPEVDGPPPPPYVPLGPRTDIDISWCLSPVWDTTRMDLDTQRETIRAGLEEWSAYSPVRFTFQASCAGADLPIGFHSGAHGHSKDFDDAGTDTDGDGFIDDNRVAHASLPGSSTSYLHFDAYEDWSATAGELWPVSAHEAGHWLGLLHSDGSESGPVTDAEADAIMTTTYNVTALRTELGTDDIAGIQALYPPDACDYGYARADIMRTYVGLAQVLADYAADDDATAAPVATWYTAATTTSAGLVPDARTMAIEGAGSATAAVVHTTTGATIKALHGGRTKSGAITVSTEARTLLDDADDAANLAILHGNVLRSDATLCP